MASLMRDKLNRIGLDLIHQVMVKSRKLTQSQKLQAIKGIAPRGVNDYKDSVKTTLAVIALDAIDQARKEVPKKKNVRLTEQDDSIHLAEFERLPPSLQKKIKMQTDLLVGKQLGDLQKVIEFAYQTAEEETDSDDLVESELNDSAIGWIDGTAMDAGAHLSASKVINNARSAFFTDDEVLEEVEAFEFKNGDPVTDICKDLNGTIFSKDDPSANAYWPPLHWNCASYIVPILMGNLKGRDIEKLAPSKKSLDDQVQFHENFDGTCGHHS